MGMRVRLLPVVLMLGACAAVPEGQRGELTLVSMKGVGMFAGEIGQTVLVPQGDATQVSVEVSGVPERVTRPVHLYTFIHRGTCGQMDASPAYEANRVVLASTAGSRAAGPFRVSNVAKVALAELRGSPYVVVIRSAPADGNELMFCGDIR